MIKMTIPGKPMGKQRVRVLRNGFSYTPKETVNYETQIRERFSALYPHWKPVAEPIKLSVKAFFPIPMSKSHKQQKAMAQGLIRPTVTPDVDNIIKIVSDALNQIAYIDDKQVVSAYCSKFYDPSPRLEIEIDYCISLD